MSAERATRSGLKHTVREFGGGRYAKANRCDCCGGTAGVNGDYITDDEVCGQSDDPGFIICFRDSCAKKLAGLGVEQRRALYTAQRAKNDAKSGGGQ